MAREVHYVCDNRCGARAMTTHLPTSWVEVHRSTGISTVCSECCLAEWAAKIDGGIDVSANVTVSATIIG